MAIEVANSRPGSNESGGGASKSTSSLKTSLSSNAWSDSQDHAGSDSTSMLHTEFSSDGLSENDGAKNLKTLESSKNKNNHPAKKTLKHKTGGDPSSTQRN